MPFTFSHPAAVLPLGYFPKRYFSMTGLVIGSTAPDFEYFIRMKNRSYYSHSWTGLFWFDLPLVIILAFIFHGMVRNMFLDNLPAIFAKRVAVFKNFNWVSYFKKYFHVVVISAMIGTASHIIWDGFTHHGGFFVKEFDVLKRTYQIAGYSIPVYELLQQLSTVIGGLIIIYVVLKLPAEKEFKRERSIFLYWFYVGIITLFIVAIRALVGLKNHSFTFEDLIMTIISGWLLGLILTPKIMTTLKI